MLLQLNLSGFERFWRSSKKPVMRLIFALMPSKDAALYRIVPTSLTVEKVKNMIGSLAW
jgi:hypothetical protein